MDKNCIRKFAVQARRDLIEQITNQANLLGIDKDGAAEELSSSTSEIKFYKDEHSAGITGQQIQWRQNLVHRLEERSKSTDWETAFTDTIEEVSYTWFNRIIALRFMEVNDYLPSRIRVLSSEEGRNEPDIVFYAEDHELQSELNIVENSDLELIRRAKASERGNDLDAMYQMLFFKQVDELNKILPGLFERTSDYMKLLFTPRYNTGVIKNLIDQIPEAYFDVHQEGQVEIIGWLYQFYNSELKDAAFKKSKYTTSDIPAVTQLFTPEWIVRYLVQNSLGRYWIEILQARGDNRNEIEIANSYNWKYYMPTFSKNNFTDDSNLLSISVIDLTFLDPAMGSGHILIYAFEVFLQIYQTEGYTKREAAHLIVENNLFGLDIDKRAYQLAYFSLMMKGRENDRRFFKNKIFLNIVDVPETNFKISELIPNNNIISQDFVKNLENLIKKFNYGNDLGSLIKIDKNIDLQEIGKSINNILPQGQLTFMDIKLEDYFDKLKLLIKTAKLLDKKYSICVSNPPYMGSSKMDQHLKKYVQKEYPSSKTDLFSVFVERILELTISSGYIGMITQQSWMFLSSFEKFRNNIQQKTIVNMAHLGSRAFEEIGGEIVQSTAFILKNEAPINYIGTYERLVDFKTAANKEKAYLKAINDPNCKYLYRSNQTNFQKIPGSPIAYWFPASILKIFNKYKKLDYYSKLKSGLTTGDNNKFERKWYEVKFENIGFNLVSVKQTSSLNFKWYPINSGGNFRKWIPIDEYIVNWQKNGYEIKNFKTTKGKLKSRPQNTNFYFKEGLTWNKISSNKFSIKYKKSGYIFDDTSRSMFFKNQIDQLYILGFLNSNVTLYILRGLNPTMSFTNGDLVKLPVINSNIFKTVILENVKSCIKQSQNDLNNFETNSYHFIRHPFLNHIAEHKQNWSLEEAYQQWQQEALDRFNQLKSNEEELNKIFIDLYGLQEELTPEEDDKDVSVRKADQLRDVKSFLSYFIGCVFGRYSLDVEGLAYAGGEWDSAKYHSFTPNTDNVLVLTDADYFGDNRDIIYRLKEFLKIIFGDDNLYKNLDFIASTLEPKKFDKGVEATDIIRQYFLNDFFKKDHLKIYQKRPIYWELNSGRAQAFKALIYLHRYNPDTMAMVRSSYLHELQQAYENTLKMRQEQLKMETDKKQIKLFNKEISKLKKQIAEIIKYDQELQHVANQRIELNLDDGVLVNHKKVQAETKILTPIK